MAWGKVGFAILSFIGILVAFSTKNYNMALFFAIIFSVLVWLISRSKTKKV